MTTHVDATSGELDGRPRAGRLRRARSPTRRRPSSLARLARSRPATAPQTAPSPSCCSQARQLLLAGGAARRGRRTSSRTSGSSPTPGPEPDVDALREALANLLEPIDEYAEVFDPLLADRRPTLGRISDDIADVAADLAHGLAHYAAGRIGEALWWWQFSYLSNWGQQALSAHRALLSIVSHQRLDVDEEAVIAAEATRSCASRHPGRCGRSRVRAAIGQRVFLVLAPGGTALLDPVAG